MFSTHANTTTAISGGFRGGRAGSGAPFGQRTDVVTVLLTIENGTELVLNFDRSVVKHALQNTRQLILATSGFLTALERTKFVVDRGKPPDPAAGLTALPRLPSWFKASYF